MIEHNIPDDILRPGAFSQIDVNSSIQGLVKLPNAVELVGVMGSGGTATVNEEQLVTDEASADVLFDLGSEAALMCREALLHARLKGQHVPLYCTGIADPAGTAAIHQFLVATGTAAAAGTIKFRVGNVRFTAGVAEGDNQDAVGLAMVAAVQGNYAKVPVIAAAGLTDNICKLTMRYTGVNGNDLQLFVDDVGKTGLVITPSTPTAGVGAATIATALANILTLDRHIVAIANHAAADVTAADTHLDLAWLQDQAGWRWVFIGETGSIATCNALAPNDYRQITLSYENSPSLPSQIAAAAAVDAAGFTAPNHNHDASELPTIGIPALASRYGTDERETALAGGSTPLRVEGGKTVIDRLITTKITDGGNPFDAVRDFSTINTVVYMAKQAHILFSGFSGKNKSARVLKRMRTALYALHEDAEDLEYIEGVEALASQLKVEGSPTNLKRAVTNQPVKPVDNLHQRVTKTVLHNKLVTN